MNTVNKKVWGQEAGQVRNQVKYQVVREVVVDKNHVVDEVEEL